VFPNFLKCEADLGPPHASTIPHTFVHHAGVPLSLAIFSPLENLYHLVTPHHLISFIIIPLRTPDAKELVCAPNPNAVLTIKNEEGNEDIRGGSATLSREFNMQESNLERPDTVEEEREVDICMVN